MATKTKLNKPSSTQSFSAILATRIAVLIVVVVAIYTVFSVYNTYTIYQQSLTSQQQLIAQEAGKSVSSFIQNKFSTMETAVGLTDPISVSADAQKIILDNLLAQDSAFRQFALLDSQGQQLSQTSRASQSLSAQFVTQLKGDALTLPTKGQRYVSSVYIDDLSSEPLIAISIPINNVFGDFQGILVGEVNLKFMWDLVDQLKVGETGYAYVVNDQGNLIAFNDTSRVLANENVKQIGEVSLFVKNPSASTDVTPTITSYTGLLGQAVVGTYVPIGTPQWAVIIELPAAEANQPIYRLVLINFISILAFTLLGGLAGFLIARLLTAPLVDLSTTAKQFASGNLEVEAKVVGAAEVAQVADSFNIMASRLRETIGGLEQRVADRTKALEISSEVSRRLSTILNQTELVAEIVNQGNNAFGFYHTQVYFYDAPRENLVMAGGTGEAGEKMLAQFHKVAKGRGLVGRAAETNKVILVSDTSQNREWLPNPLLPDTKSEVAIPIALGNEVLGVLDVQHNIVNGLHQEDVDSLQSIANQIAGTMQNIRQYQNTQKIASDMSVVAEVGIATSTITDSQKLLQEVADLSKESFNLYHVHIYLLNEANDTLELTAGAGEVGKQMVAEGRSIPLDSEKSLVARAARAGEGVVVNDVTLAPDFLPNPLLPHTRSEMAVPMLVAGKVIGVLDVQSEAANRFTEVDISIKTTLASQIAVALQNARSFSHSQRQAERETAVNLIVQKIQNTTSVEAALQIAARELGHALGMKPTLVELNRETLSGEANVKETEPMGTGVSK